MLFSEECLMKKTSAHCNEDAYFSILHLSKVELRRKLQEKLKHVTVPELFFL